MESVQVDEEGTDLGQHRLENTLHQTMTEAKVQWCLAFFSFLFLLPAHA